MNFPEDFQKQTAATKRFIMNGFVAAAVYFIRWRGGINTFRPFRPQALPEQVFLL